MADGKKRRRRWPKYAPPIDPQRETTFNFEVQITTYGNGDEAQAMKLQDRIDLAMETQFLPEQFKVKRK